MRSSSPAGYIYPSLWLQENFEKNITDLSHAVQSDSYGSAFARLASGQIDVLCTYADARRDYEDEWTGEYAMTNGIWAYCSNWRNPSYLQRYNQYQQDFSDYGRRL